MHYWLKACRRCCGDLRQESDIYGRYIACVQCGYILTQAEEVRLITLGAAREPEPAGKAA